MAEKVTKIRVFVGSPGDVNRERKAFPNIIERLNKGIAGSKGIILELVMWETDTWPGFGHDAQKVIDEQIGTYDIFIGIMWNRLGTPTSDAPSGTVEEFMNAYRLWQEHKCPKLMFYFKNEASLLLTKDEVEQRGEVIEFQEFLGELGGYYWNYESIDEFKEKLFDHLAKEIIESSKTPVTWKPEPEGIEPEEVDSHDIAELQVANRPKLYSSFQPARENQFLLIGIDTTPGCIDDEDTSNRIHIVRDPIRPYEIHISEIRCLRRQRIPEAIADLANLELEEIRNIYPFIHIEKYRWLRMVLAELATNSDILDFLWEEDGDEDVKGLAAKNPSASRELQKKGCLFCNPGFRDRRRLAFASSKETIIFRNDYPYGPYCHYIAMPVEPIHSWEDINLNHLQDMNKQIWKFLNGEKNKPTFNSAGIFIGFNSTIRHLVLGRRIRTSAGASVAHVHKQIWGMTPGSVNLGDHLSEICSAYYSNAPRVDYLKSYLDALRKAGYVIWEDQNVALYIPFGQISIHELQIMVKEEKHDYLELDEQEVDSLSKAEFYVTQLYKRIGIHSFNEVLITEPFDRQTNGFRLIMTFITREIDLAVAELNHLYIVDRYPKDTLDQVNKHRDAVFDEDSGCKIRFN